MAGVTVRGDRRPTAGGTRGVQATLCFGAPAALPSDASVADQGFRR